MKNQQPHRASAEPRRRPGRPKTLAGGQTYSIILEEATRLKLEVLSRGLDVAVAVLIRDVIDKALALDLRLRQFAHQQAHEDVERAKIRGQELTTPTTAQRVSKLLEEGWIERDGQEILARGEAHE